MEETNYTVLPSGFTPETFEERKDIRRRARAAVIPAIILMAVSFLWASIYYAVMGTLGFDAMRAYEIIRQPATLTFSSILISSFVFTVPFIFSAIIMGQRVGDLVPFEKPRKKTALPYFLFGLGFCAFANVSTSYAGSIFESMGINYSVDTGDSPEGFFGFMLSLIGTVAVPALCEEFACRGIMFGFLKKYGDAFAIITTSAIFGLIHGNFIQIPFAFLVGLVLGLVRVKTGSIWVCAAIHGANNLVSVIFDYMPSGITTAMQNVMYTVYLVACMLIAVVGILLLKGEKDEFCLTPPCHACAAKQKYKWFFTSAFVIVLAVICVVESLAFFK